MDTYIFLYDETSLFEVNLAAYFMNTKGDVYVVSEKDRILTTNEGIRVVADITLDQLEVRNVDVLLVCGGNIDNITSMERLSQIITECNKQHKIIGGICAGRDIVARATGIESFPEKTTISDQTILSPGNEYVDFALEVGRVANIYEDKADYQETLNFFKHFQSPETEPSN